MAIYGNYQYDPAMAASMQPQTTGLPSPPRAPYGAAQALRMQQSATGTPQRSSNPPMQQTANQQYGNYQYDSSSAASPQSLIQGVQAPSRSPFYNGVTTGPRLSSAMQQLRRMQQQSAGTPPTFYGPQQPYGTPGTPMDREDTNYNLRANAQSDLHQRNINSLMSATANPYRQQQLQTPMQTNPGLSQLQVQAMGGSGSSYGGAANGFNSTPTQMNSYQAPMGQLYGGNVPGSNPQGRPLVANSLQQMAAMRSGMVPSEGQERILPSRTKVTNEPGVGVVAQGPTGGPEAKTPAQIAAYRKTRPNAQQRLAMRQQQAGLQRQLAQFAQTGQSPMMQGQQMPQQDGSQPGQPQQAMPQQPMLNQADSAYGRIMGAPVYGMNPVTGMQYPQAESSWWSGGQQQMPQGSVNIIDRVTGEYLTPEQLRQRQQYQPVKPEWSPSVTPYTPPSGTIWEGGSYKN